MSEGGSSISKEVLDAVTGNLVTEGRKALGRKTANATAVRRLRLRLGSDLHPVLKDIIAAAIAVSVEEAEVDWRVRREFLTDPVNKAAAFFAYILDPNTVDPSTLSYRSSPIRERRRVEIFARRLFSEIRIQREKKFGPEALSILNSISELENFIEEVSRRQTGSLTATIERNAARTEEAIQSATKALGSRMIAEMQDLIERDSTRSLPRGKLKNALDEARALLKAGRPHDAREIGFSTSENLNEKVKRFPAILKPYIACWQTRFCTPRLPTISSRQFLTSRRWSLGQGVSQFAIAIKLS